MIIYPAIDIKDGKCVRLKQGRAEDSTVFFESPLDAARMWMSKGAKHLHVVDLDGAFSGTPRNLELIVKIKNETGAFVQMGGGIRDKCSVEKVLKCGIDRVILGTAAIKDIGLVKWASWKYGNRIAVSIDSVDNNAAYDGWTGVSRVDTLSLVESLVNAGVSTIVYTDISRDGMMSGPDINGIRNILNNFDVNLIASGGVSTIDDVKVLNEAGVHGSIIGRALYNASIPLEKALEVGACSLKE